MPDTLIKGKETVQTTNIQKIIQIYKKKLIFFVYFICIAMKIVDGKLNRRSQV